ncbi:predicted protein [Uncinocarpus reesii 1704]|uniref:Extracellular membrane protein CFEM domain-containing protein n=1 Tax=Uncinocarpus reesii (strain UAMH 1704) TaxID=336963 RepID=C4JW04_UNCRE|nr:uncharacterized protein UREG_06746 [Uncinocarpus reesii 1704]EEP81881.1 predicted protein [Uncinocarpus reesii 1704]
MKFSGVIALSLIAVASAQSEAPSTTVELSPVASCAAQCPDTDLCCQAACAGVPCPDHSGAIKTNECSAKCEQGDGSPGQTEAFARCQAACVKSFFLTYSAAPAATQPGSPSNSAVPTGDSTDAPTRSGSEPTGTSTPTGDASSTTTPNAAAPLSGSSAATFLGLVLAAFAL